MKRTITFLFAAAMLAALHIQSFACACCAETGHYSLRTSKPDAYALDLLRDIQFEKAADLYTTEAGFDMIKGLGPVRTEYESDSWTADSRFDIVSVFTNASWRLNLKTPKGLKGGFVLPMPAQMVTYKVDIHDEENRPNGPNLYKEFRFKGTLNSASGFAGSGIARGTTYFLVFQGRGNGCDNASDFTHWRLEISGPRADYAFFGRLDTESARKAELAEQ